MGCKCKQKPVPDQNPAQQPVQPAKINIRESNVNEIVNRLHKIMN